MKASKQLFSVNFCALPKLINAMEFEPRPPSLLSQSAPAIRLNDILIEEEQIVLAEKIEDTLRPEETEQLRVSYDTSEKIPEETIVVFDLHHVLMRPQYGDMVRKFFNHPKKTALFKLATSPTVLRKFVNRIGKEVPEKSMRDLELELNGSPHNENLRTYLSPLVVDICNCQKPDLPTFQLVERLKDNGYGIYLLSNIGIGYFQDLRAKLEVDLFARFDGIYTTNPEDDYCKKPNLGIFERFLKQFNGEGRYKHVVFVDDSIANVNACSQLGMIGIQYTDAMALESKFKEIGICCDHINKE